MIAATNSQEDKTRSFKRKTELNKNLIFIIFISSLYKEIKEYIRLTSSLMIIPSMHLTCLFHIKRSMFVFIHNKYFYL